MRTQRLSLALFAALLLAGAGCQRQPAASVRTDQQITADVQSKLQAESALSGQNIQVGVNNGTVTLSGTASDAASRALAGNDAGAVSGVKTVVNNLLVQPPQTAAAPAPAPAPAPQETPRERRRRERERAQQDQQDQMAQNTPPPPVSQPTPAPQPAPTQAAPPPPPQPVVKTITFPAGTVIPIRTSEPLSSANAQPNQSFHGTIAADMVSQGMIAIPQGTPVLGRVVDAKDAARFKGSSLLSIELTRIDLRGRQIPVVTDAYSKEGAGRGKSTATKVGGGALLGTLIGALAGGGKGAAIGAAAGAGAGTGVAAATKGQQVQFPSEMMVNFRLQSPITVTTSRQLGSAPPANQQQPDPELQQRQPQ